jgi:ubiquinone/menaquinone biosynthesis C-methylase UbiE
MNTYNTRNVEYKKIHSVSEDLYTKVLDSLDLFPGAAIADLMAGHGEMSDAIVKYCCAKGFIVNGIMLDAYEKQMPERHIFTKVVGDIRKPVLAENSLDRTVMKLGLHEIPQKDQQLAISQVYRALKPNGICVFWELGLSDTYEQDIFQKIVRKKDALAGFDDLVKNRYFCTETELRTYFQKSGFDKIEIAHSGTFYINTSRWLENDFRNNENKLEELNQFILDLPQGTKEKYHFKKDASNICMEFAWPIFKVVK